ncbi:MAG TPA: TRAP transporter fused permease subunit [Burkholderiales bacterium]|nr:TRAP transporter fused permease subunit [Burkholderiales bacterium]
MAPAPVPGDARLEGAFARRLVASLATAITLGAVLWSMGIAQLLALPLYTEQFVAAMLSATLALAYLHLPARQGAPRSRVPWYDWLAALAAIGAGMYLAARYPALVDVIMLRPRDAVIVGTLLIVLLLEALRRGTGPALPVIVVCFLVYALVADAVPGRLQGRASDWPKLAGYLAVDTNGMLGLPITIGTTIVATFIFFGALLSATGGSRFFTELALVWMGRYRGGSAKIAVVASALFGSISGSAVANVVATGVVTIPLIIRSGYKPHQAGAIEAVASTGGQLMPPVMGASAFLMAEFLQIPYSAVVLAALVPALLYYLTLFIQADLEAGRVGIKAVDPEDIPRVRDVLPGLHFTVPFAVLIVALFRYNLQPETAALWSSLALVVLALAFGYRGERPALAALFGAFRTTGLATVEIILITAAAGLVIGVLGITGLGFNLTMALVTLGSGSLLALLALAAIVCIILGMGLPTVGVYALLAALVAPALVEVGVMPIAAHMYVMYFGMMSMITPPVALAAYAAAGLARADPMRTGLEACRFGWSAFLVPFLFVLSPTLLLIGPPASIALAVVTAALGIWLASIAVIGYFVRPLGGWMRALFGFAGLMALIPAGAFEGAIITDVIGTALGSALIAREVWLARSRRRTSTPSHGTAPGGS